MGGVGRVIRIAEQEPGQGDPEALHRAVWARVQDAWSMWSVPGSNGRAIETYLWDAPSDDPGLWGASRTELSFFFRDLAGCCNRSADAALHWFELALAMDWQGLCALAEEHSFRVQSAPFVPGDVRLVPLRGELWSVHPQLTGPPELVGDNCVLAFADLDASEQGEVNAAIEACRCPACALVRPDPAIADAFIQTLAESAEPDVLGSIAWYIGRMQTPSASLLSAVGSALLRMPQHSRPLLSAIERLAPRLDALPDIPEHPGTRAMQLAWAEARGLFDRRAVLEALASDPPTSGLAAEIAGRHLRSERDILWLPIVEVLARIEQQGKTPDEETRHTVVLALVNLFLPRGPVPPEVLALFEREAKRDPDAQGPSASVLARWALGQVHQL